MSIKILGLDVNDYNTSAALLINGRIVSAAQEERFNREKLTRKFPINSINYCLSANSLNWNDLDAVAVSVNPAIYLECLNVAQSERARYRGEILYAVPNFILGLQKGISTGATNLNIHIKDSKNIKLHYITHHDSHAATAYFTSKFEDSAILTLDGFGEKETVVYYKAVGNKITRLQSIEFPHSIGCFYAVMTEFLGYKPFNEEWKIMGASAYGNYRRYYHKLKNLIRYTGDGRFEMDLTYFNHYQFHRPGGFTNKLINILGLPYSSKCREHDERFFDIASAVQKVTEELVFELLRYLYSIVPTKNLCLSGGVAMNCVLNGKITSHTPFENVFIPPMPDDSGSSIGAALYAFHHIYEGKSRWVMKDSYLGPSFSDDEIRRELNKFKLDYRELKTPEKEAAKLLSEGKIVGWFQGGMEFGDRALGNRSILADPRRVEIKDMIIERIKFREKFQPFAPSILDEFKNEYFENVAFTPFMEKTYKVLPQKRRFIQAVVHNDNSSRIQTVTKEQNPKFYKLIFEFKKLTGIPLVLNTSFNVSGEPIVCNPTDAVRTFYSCGLDALIIGKYLLIK